MPIARAVRRTRIRSKLIKRRSLSSPQKEKESSCRGGGGGRGSGGKKERGEVQTFKDLETTQAGLPKERENEIHERLLAKKKRGKIKLTETGGGMGRAL